MDQQRKRPRRYTVPRSRTGCTTCRKRRVKCDETGPPCKRCLAMGLTCKSINSSLAPNASGLSPFARTAAAAASSRPHTGLAWRIAPAAVDTTRQEVRIFDMFRKEFISRIAGPIDKPFWMYDILQAASTYPSVWHACLALAAAYSEPKSKSSSGGDPSALAAKRANMAFVHKQYAIAVSSIRQLTAKNTLTHSEHGSLLMSSILLAGLCALMLNSHEALLHAQHGVQIYHKSGFRSKAMQENNASKGAISGLFINGMISSLEAQLLYKQDTPCTSTWETFGNILPCSDTPYQNTTQAFYELQPLFSGFHRGMLSSAYPDQAAVPASITRAKQAYYHELSRWRHKLKVFQQSDHYNPASPDAIMLRVHTIAINIMARMCSSDRDVDDPKYVDEYVEMADLFEKALGTDFESSVQHGLCTPMLTYSSGLCTVAAILMGVCPSVAVHRRVIDLMLKYDRHEGTWHSGCIGAIQTAKANMQEDAMNEAAIDTESACECVAPDYVCGMHRVVFNSFIGHQGDHILMRLLTKQDVQQGRPGQEMAVLYA